MNLNEKVSSPRSVLLGELERHLPPEIPRKSAGRHAKEGELIRLDTTPRYSKEDLKKIIIDACSDIAGVELGEFGMFTSHKFESQKILFEGQPYYVTITDQGKKTYTVNKVIPNLHNLGYVNYLDLADQLEDKNGIQLKELYRQAVENCTGTVESFRTSFDPLLMEQIDDKVVSSFFNDFGEILGAGCFAKILGESAKIRFPSASNEALADYIIMTDDNKYIVSEKAGMGAAPSSAYAISQALEYCEKGSRTENFLKWMHEHVAATSIHDGFRNLADLALNGASWYVPAVNNARVEWATTGAVTPDNVEKFLDDIRMTLREAGISESVQPDNPGASEAMSETIRIRYLARLAIISINSDEELIAGFNRALSKALGNFIQVYLNWSKFYVGELSFKTRRLSADTDGASYYFRDASAISNDRLGMKRLCIVLR